jgi:hypothetical protein
MPVFLEFLLVAFLFYLLESALWLPKQGFALRRSWFGKSWRVIPATRLIATRELGLVLMLPVPLDSGLAPCPGFPLTTDANGNIYLESADGNFMKADVPSWEEVRFNAPRLLAGKLSIRCQSPGMLESLREGKALGLDLQSAIRRSTALSLSPARAKMNLKKWKIVSSSLRFYAPVLTIGFFLGLPAAYVALGPMPALWLGAWLWCLMLSIGCHLMWIAKHVYPSCRSEIRQDALLSFLIPFHAMRAMELVSAQAFSRLHPAAVLISSGATDHPWLCGFVRKLMFPRTNYTGDAALAFTVLPILEKILIQRNMKPGDFDVAPDHSSDPEAKTYCPRCHGMFLGGTDSCTDCGGLPLRPF